MDPALYRCAIGLSGVYDWGALMTEKRVTRECFDELSFGTMIAREGERADHQETYDAMSPAAGLALSREPNGRI